MGERRGGLPMWTLAKNVITIMMRIPENTLQYTSPTMLRRTITLFSGNFNAVAVITYFD